jgi:CubicO group peptidase (beta-lactamase class C family)
MHTTFNGPWVHRVLLWATTLLATGDAIASELASGRAVGIGALDSERAGQIDSAVPRILDRDGVATAGIGLIRGGKLVWAGYYGEQAPGVPAARSTLFNVASITKTVTAEVILRLAADGRLSLDESMAAHWVDPDLVADPRHRDITPRMALSHTIGFPNWRGRNKLTLSADPGTAFEYSGEGYNYVARFAEEKLGREFHKLASDHVFEPWGMTGVSIATPNGWIAPFLALPTDEAQDGTRLDPGCGTTGQFCLCRSDPRPMHCRRWTSADDMVVSVEDYAAFLIGLMHGEGLTDELWAQRFDPVVFPRGDWNIVACEATDGTACPSEGWALGWEVVDYGTHRLVTHGGADWGEVALAFFYPESRDGLIVFLNGRRPRAYRAMAEVIRLFDPDSPLADRYERWYRDQ